MGENELPEAAAAREWLATMTLIRRFEERAGEMYAKAKIGGFLHLAIGEEATIVGSARAMRDDDYLISTYRSHGHAIARGTNPEAVMAELFGRVDGCSKGRGGSMHMFDLERRFMGGYGIVGGNLPIATGLALGADYQETEDAVLCQFGDGAANQGTFGEALNLAALWKLPVVFLCENNLYAMGTALERSESETDIHLKARSYRIPSKVVDGMDVVAVERAVRSAARAARKGGGPQFLELRTYRFRAHSMYDAELYRTKDEVGEWMHRDPIALFEARLRADGLLGDADLASLESDVATELDAAVAEAEAGPWEPVEELTRNVYANGART